MDGYTKEIGNATWNFLYTLAKGYPSPAPASVAESAKRMVQELSKCYTCGKCQKDFEDFVKKNPPKTCCKNSFNEYLNSLSDHVAKTKLQTQY